MIKKCIALDIDGTLFYTSTKEFDNSIKLPNDYYAISRPFINELFEYLQNNREYFEVIIYSAATEDYINHLLNLIDTKNIITKIYDRKFCDKIFINNKETCIKNAKNIKYDFSNLYLIDDNDFHFNEYDILGYKCNKFQNNNENDFEIFEIINFLETLKHI